MGGAEGEWREVGWVGERKGRERESGLVVLYIIMCCLLSPADMLFCSLWREERERVV